MDIQMKKDDKETVHNLLSELIETYEDGENIMDLWTKIVRKYPKSDNALISKHELRSYIAKNSIELPAGMQIFLSTKPTRTISGVAPITIFTKPYQCSGHCIFCPTALNAPKSYLPEEPGIQRAIDLDYDPFQQVSFRVGVFKKIGHEIDKIELIISGGTWDDYPLNYRIWFMQEVFRALNRQPSEEFDPSQSYQTPQDINKLWQLQETNSTTKSRAVGITIETRPDKITKDSLAWLRRFGVTKIQLGIQSMDDNILDLNNRGHSVQEAIDAVNLIRQAGFKVHVHWMANLYGSNPEKDIEDFQRLFSTSLNPDELKIYPCSIVEGTVLYNLFKQGKYKPYDTETLVKTIAKCKTFVPQYCRITRVFRDIPSNLIVAGNKYTNLREMVKKSMHENGTYCRCIRCNEIKNQEYHKILPKQITYTTDVSQEYFLYYVSETGKILGFLRLSIYKEKSLLIPVKAMIREIHVYGRAQQINRKSPHTAQHIGIGTKLIQRAEKICKNNNIKKIGVISGVGTRQYYIKRGFNIEEDFGYGIKEIA